MNILITSCGRRTELIKYFKNEFENEGNVIVTDCSDLAPALYFADKYYITSRIDADTYINEILDICEKEKIDGILSLIDPELELLSKNRESLKERNIMLIGSNYEETNVCFDKYKTYLFLEEHGFKCAKTYIDINFFKEDLENGKITLPVFIKPRSGSASIGISKVDNIKHLELIYEMCPDMIIQEFIAGQEYGVDSYIDIISKEAISIFIKEKVRMRAGETDKAKSVVDKKLFDIIEKLLKDLKLVGPIDVDVFKNNDEWIISEINPRFGGGYPLAYNCGENFVKYIMNNIKREKNERKIGTYNEGIYMLKHDTLIVK